LVKQVKSIYLYTLEPILYSFIVKKIPREE
jgi:hypothetical protein